jgi:chemosensory pili system protein ChpC
LSLPITTTSVKKYRIIVLYGLESTQTMPFYAFRAIDVPRTIAITEASLTNPSTNISRGLVFKVMYNTEVILLPNLTYLERLLKTFPIFSG